MTLTALYSFQNDLDKVRLINYRVYETKLANLFCKLGKAGYEPILIKGWAAAQYYPKPCNRISGDVDMVFRPEEVKDVKIFLSGYADLPIDIHSGLRRLDTVDFEDLYKHSLIIDCQGTAVRVLRVEDHVRVLCVHWMSDGGANKEKLWDLFYAIDRFRENFDWSRCLDVVNSIRKAWIKCVIGLTYDYLGLETINLPFANELKDNPVWLNQAVEKEWKSKTKLNSLHLFMHNKKLLVKQILKRIPPNPLQATVELEKDIRGEIRFHYQFINMFTRLSPSLQRIFKIEK